MSRPPETIMLGKCLMAGVFVVIGAAFAFRGNWPGAILCGFLCGAIMTREE